MRQIQFLKCVVVSALDITMNKNISPQMSNCRSLEQKLFFEHEKEYDMTYGNSVSYLLRNSYKSRMNNVF